MSAISRSTIGGHGYGDDDRILHSYMVTSVYLVVIEQYRGTILEQFNN